MQETIENPSFIPENVETHIEKLCRYLSSDKIQKKLRRIINLKQNGIGEFKRLLDDFGNFEDCSLHSLHPKISKHNWLIDCKTEKELFDEFKNLISHAISIFFENEEFVEKIAQAINCSEEKILILESFMSEKDVLLNFLKSYLFHHIMHCYRNLRPSLAAEINPLVENFWKEFKLSELLLQRHITENHPPVPSHPSLVSEDPNKIQLDPSTINDLRESYNSLMTQKVWLEKRTLLCKASEELPDIRFSNPLITIFCVDRKPDIEVNKLSKSTVLSQCSENEINMAVKYKSICFMVKELEEFLKAFEDGALVPKEKLDKLIESKNKCQSYSPSIIVSNTCKIVIRGQPQLSETKAKTYSIDKHRHERLENFLNWLKFFITLGLKSCPSKTKTQNLISTPVEKIEKALPQLASNCHIL